MEAKVLAIKPVDAPAWLTDVALILFSVICIGALMVWISTSRGGPDDKAVLTTLATNPPEPPRAKARAAPARVVASSVPSQAGTQCAECGVVESAREVDVKGKGSGLGGVGGAVAGNEVEKRVKPTKR
jgi:hypothetical protein